MVVFCHVNIPCEIYNLWDQGQCCKFGKESEVRCSKKRKHRLARAANITSSSSGFLSPNPCSHSSTAASISISLISCHFLASGSS